ncbi:acylphosphatase [Cognatilysobacter lacus]|uniref:acylphosphatase n=1 Tax=Cognatilysobacter lacus TaxID=1643323 RepID=A0A5D8Z4X5_9GAMM|nr:acylphosphatase [Lysobacter lacus]TZF89576.1 acylphosphatase [Lysobacter lacus]
MSAARFVVSGHVQGVAFRARARHEALRLGISGRAINLDDGCVEVVAHGEPAALEQFARWLAHGPPLARVEHVVRERVDEAPMPRGFSVG